MAPTGNVVPGSLQAVAGGRNVGLAEAFMAADIVVLVDTSSSMAACDSREGQSRYTVACQELRALQADLPGKIAVVSFSSSCLFCPGGIPANQGGGTDLAGALRFVLPADGTLDLWVISDGEPQGPEQCLRLAATMASRINCVYVGPPGGEGRDFLRRLAAVRGGKSGESPRAVGIAATIRGMLGAG